MKLKNAVVLLPFLLSGCGISFGPESAVEDTSIAEMIVYSQVMRDTNDEQIERLMDKLHEVAPFDVDTTIGDGVDECDSITDFSVHSNSDGQDGYVVASRFTIDDTFSVRLNFVGRGLDMGLTTAFKELYLMNMTISQGDKRLYAGDGRSEATAKMLRLLLVDCSIGDMLKGYVASQR
ncbi:hypothetical protein RE428_10400 [Marinobacter nanhaiticus D15-8W]|uniref:Lipoprotein n=1 Tax=Marinobacter nanhaiticus D15-8W TaxID=626887 RepID=N6WV35_9GAMM|nr:hypothetical protein [Marinobacter nanhaiticus]ENO12683.1 hypothetical protein J057_14815 [Marinobacter nanhaiticus D15-8W]BES70022.1 hypothetical protein RE428_10400 [Marinobacter nanhaiticus D15-8W]